VAEKENAIAVSNPNRNSLLKLEKGIDEEFSLAHGATLQG